MQDDRYAGIRALMVFAGAVAAALLIVAATPHKAKAAGLTCDLEGSAGVGITQDHLTAAFGGPTTSVDLSQMGGLLGLGAGCDVQLSQHFYFGGLGRYSWSQIVGDIGAMSVKTDHLAELGARVGVNLTPKTSAYALLGWSWDNVDLSALGVANKNPNGLLLGLGVEHNFANSPIFVRAEVTDHRFASQDLGPGVSATPDLWVARIALGWKFGAGSSAVVPLK